MGILLRRLKSGRKKNSSWYRHYDTKSIVVMIGTNDHLRRRNLNRMGREVKHLMSVIKRTRARRGLVCSISPLKGNVNVQVIKLFTIVKRRLILSNILGVQWILGSFGQKVLIRISTCTNLSVRIFSLGIFTHPSI